jgi:hypothetical protein
MNMRIVPNLTNLTECPNCGETFYLKEMKNEFGRPFVLCVNCHEEIFENETTCSAEKTAKEKEKENFISEMREEISNLTWSIHDSKTQILVENIQNILNRIIDYIEEN